MCICVCRGCVSRVCLCGDTCVCVCVYVGVLDGLVCLDAFLCKGGGVHDY